MKSNTKARTLAIARIAFHERKKEGIGERHMHETVRAKKRKADGGAIGNSDGGTSVLSGLENYFSPSNQEWAPWPVRVVRSGLSALAAPHDAYTGDLPMMDSSGHTSDDAIKRSADLAGLMALGGTGAPSGAIGSGAMIPKRAPLPMDEASRLARAKDMGFYTEMPLYHGTGETFGQFKAVPTNADGWATPGVSTAVDPEIANEFATRPGSGLASPQVHKLFHRADSPAVLTLTGNESHREVVGALRDAFANGYDAVRLRNYTSPDGKKGDIVIVKDANQLRSPAAKFDPAKKASSDLLASNSQGESVKALASGGAVNPDPVTDPALLAQLNAPDDAAPKPVTDPAILAQLNAPDEGKLHALAHGAAAGATFNLSDELAGLEAAKPRYVPSAVGPIPTGALAGAARLGVNYFTGSDPESVQKYEQARDAERTAQESAKANHPYMYGAGEVAGSLPAMAALPEMGFIKGAGVASDIGRSVLTGAGYGAASGLGEGKTAEDRAANAGLGGLGGAAAGAIGPVVGKAASAVYDRFGKPVVQTIRGWMDPEAEAARRVASALQKDSAMIMDGTAKGMTPGEWVAARNAGEPVTLADLGAGNVQSLLRSAANTSPEGRAMLEKVIEDRFLGQSERVANDVRGLVAGGANAGKTGDQLVAEYDLARKPAYKNAYNQGDRPIMTPTMERMMGSDTFVAAMKRAISSGKDRDVAMGFGGFNPMVSVTDDGRILFNKGAKGVPTYPNLQYWDQVKRELDSVANQAKRSGDTASVAGDLARSLRNELDSQVPNYAKARGIAEQYFGDSNALDAGRDLAGKKVTPDFIKDAMRKMSPQEQDLFREGYASDWANRVIGDMRDTRDITKAMFNSPNERARAEAVFGPAGMAKIEARMTLESIMDGARKAMGNSTTARQLIEAGLAGGALSGYASGWDPVKTVEGAGAAAGARFGAGKFIASEMSAGAKKLIGKVDATTARNVARLLTSDDPNDLAKGIRMAVKNQKISDGLKRIANTLSLSSLAPQGREGAIRAAQTLQSNIPAHADDQKSVP